MGGYRNSSFFLQLIYSILQLALFKLSLSYNGVSPEFISVLGTHSTAPDSKISMSLPSEYDKIEFLDHKIVNEDQIMVSEYFSIPCSCLEYQTSESLVVSDAMNELSTEDSFRVVESFSTAIEESVQIWNLDSPPSSVSTNGVSSPQFLQARNHLRLQQSQNI